MMDEFDKKLNELKPYMGATDAEGVARKEELFAWLEAHCETAEAQARLEAFVSQGLAEMKTEVESLRAQINSSAYDLLPLAYIAEHYFNKSRAWLYQRINGNRVRGRVYTLSDSEKDTFNRAVQDIAKKIGSVRIA